MGDDHSTNPDPHGEQALDSIGQAEPANDPEPAIAVVPPERSVTRKVDLERREDRYIIFVRDTAELIEALGAHTRTLEFEDTPVTRTVYFGDTARGLPPGLSIKARSYERERLHGRWDLSAESAFELLELKRTVEQRAAGGGKKSSGKSGKGKKKHKRRDAMVEILRLSGSILSRSTFKTKRREPNITLAELSQLITDPMAIKDDLSLPLYVHLLETVHPLRDFRWRPVIGTEYRRIHFVTREPAHTDIFRATLDTRVTHYAFDSTEGGEDLSFVGVPVSTEGFSRFEIKADRQRIAKTPLGDWLEQILVDFRAFRIPSKKYRGMTERSNYLIAREGFRNEMPGKRIYAEYKSRPVRYRDHEHYINLARYLQSSKSFHLLGDEATLLESHEHSVQGRYKGLSIKITGSQLTHNREPEVLCEKPVTIKMADRVPVTDLPLTSRDDVDATVGASKMDGRSTHYIRSRSFLVESSKSGRVYKVGLERRIRAVGEASYFVVVEYVGRARERAVFGTKDIVRDITSLVRFLKKDPLLSRS